MRAHGIEQWPIGTLLLGCLLLLLFWLPFHVRLLKFDDCWIDSTPFYVIKFNVKLNKRMAFSSNNCSAPHITHVGEEKTNASPKHFRLLFNLHVANDHICEYCRCTKSKFFFVFSPANQSMKRSHGFLFIIAFAIGSVANSGPMSHTYSYHCILLLHKNIYCLLRMDWHLMAWSSTKW